MSIRQIRIPGRSNESLNQQIKLKLAKKNTRAIPLDISNIEIKDSVSKWRFIKNSKSCELFYIGGFFNLEFED